MVKITAEPLGIGIEQDITPRFWFFLIAFAAAMFVLATANNAGFFPTSWYKPIEIITIPYTIVVEVFKALFGLLGSLFEAAYFVLTGTKYASPRETEAVQAELLAECLANPPTPKTWKCASTFNGNWWNFIGFLNEPEQCRCHPGETITYNTCAIVETCTGLSTGSVFT